MNLATVVIVGRPNVGKSSLFNRILGRRAAVVADREGVTRDRHYQMAEWAGIHFQIVDTGGFMPKDIDHMDKLVRQQIETALEDADLVVFLVDGRVGITDLDQTFARLVQRADRPTMVVVNKAESQSVANEASQYWSLGLGEPMAISALHGSGVYDMLDALVARLPVKPKFVPREDKVRVAILGRPNAGKSTMVNALVGEERVITSEVAGTTRDAIDTEFEYDGRKFVLTDTAGLRRKARVKDEVEYFSNMRALEAIRRSDVCVLLVDAARGMEIQDFRICTLIQETGKGLIVCFNKWDVMEAESKTFDHMVKDVVSRNPDLEGYPFLSTSGLTGKRLVRVLEEILKVKRNLGKVLGRENVIRFFEETVAKHPTPTTSAGPATLERCCQVMVNPPALAFEVNHPERVQESYIRYLRRQAYEFFDLEGAPVRIWFRSRFKLRTDEELQAWLDWGVKAQDTEGDWSDELAKADESVDEAVREEPPERTAGKVAAKAVKPGRKAPAVPTAPVEDEEEHDFWEDANADEAEETGPGGGGTR
ncbi:MAG TPA: ribosome biogenesis GTPase Der [Fibrobacteria bacterium]|nr:ribosome biogenesis GTPase Der [Fibrobacteria bacterium]